MPITNKLNGLISYSIHDVRGDGHCFYRALYNVMREADRDSQEYLGLDGITDEMDGVEMVRGIIADGIKDMTNKLYDGSRTTIDSLCSMASGEGIEGTICRTSSPGRESCTEDDAAAVAAAVAELKAYLKEMYPFLTKPLIDVSGQRRYNMAANRIVGNPKKPMYASSLEVDQVKHILALADIALLIISDNGDENGNEEKWEKDLQKLLSNTIAKQVIVFLNINNLHYNYMSFKMPSDTKYSTVMNRQQMLDILRISSFSSLSKSSGGKKKSLPKKTHKK